MSDPVSSAHFEEAKRWMPGGVNSPVRAFRAVGGDPVFIDRAEGAHLYGADGTKYVDYVCSWGPMILGHAHPRVIEAVKAQAERGTSYGAPTAIETTMAKKIAEFFPMVEMVRLVSSGTEAVMGALRAARGYTGRDLVAKFEGCYHGGADYLLVKAGSGLATFGVPTSAGVPEAIGSTTRVLDYNDLEGVERYLEGEDGPKTAAIILEPVGGNMGCVPADQAFLEGLRDLCTRHGVVLVFDEVMTGFRLSKGGAQALYGVTPDLTCLGKVVGGGLPMGAYGGRREIMEKVSPVGPVYQAGTLSGNPLAVAAGLATLEILSEDPTVYDRLDEAGARLEASFTEMAAAKGKTIVVQRVGSMLTPFFHDGPVRSWKEAGACDTEAFGRWHQGMLRGGVHWPPAQYEAGFVSTAHDEEALGVTERAFEAALDAV